MLNIHSSYRYMYMYLFTGKARFSYLISKSSTAQNVLSELYSAHGIAHITG